MGAGGARVTLEIGALGSNEALAKGRYHPATVATLATAGRPQTGSDAAAPSTSGAAETAPREEGARALTGVGPSPPPPPLRLCPVPLPRPDPVWLARAQRPRAPAPGKCAARVAALFTPAGRGGGVGSPRASLDRPGLRLRRRPRGPGAPGRRFPVSAPSTARGGGGSRLRPGRARAWRLFPPPAVFPAPREVGGQCL